MKRIYLNVSVLHSWEVSDEYTDDDAQELVDMFMEENGLTDIANDVEWDMLPIGEKGKVEY